MFYAPEQVIPALKIRAMHGWILGPTTAPHSPRLVPAFSLSHSHVALTLAHVCAREQFIPALKIGYLYTYWGPLIFVLAVTIMKEALDDIQRWRRDKEGMCLDL